jgi:hypothetical protein
MSDGWRDRITSEVAAKAAESAKNSPGTSASQRMSRVAFSVPAHQLLVRAASARGISLSGYARRSTMAMVALDLGLDPRAVFELDAAIAPLGKGGVGLTRDLDGELWGSWEVRRP